MAASRKRYRRRKLKQLRHIAMRFDRSPLSYVAPDVDRLERRAAGRDHALIVDQLAGHDAAGRLQSIELRLGVLVGDELAPRSLKGLPPAM